MTVTDVVSLMSEGNPGAINAMMTTLQSGGTIFDLLTLDDMNIRGPQIWVGFKDFAKGKPEDFLKAIRERSQEMVDMINRESGSDERAVTSGGSWRKDRGHEPRSSARGRHGWV